MLYEVIYFLSFIEDKNKEKSCFYLVYFTYILISNHLKCNIL